jgi:hypothetical protein
MNDVDAPRISGLSRRDASLGPVITIVIDKEDIEVRTHLHGEGCDLGDIVHLIVSGDHNDRTTGRRGRHGGSRL